MALHNMQTGAKLLHGWALMAQGQRAHGLAQMRHRLTAYDATQAAQWRPIFWTYWGSGTGRRAATDEGLAPARGATLVNNTGERFYEAENASAPGGGAAASPHQHPALADDLSHRAAVEASLHQALAVARRQQAKSLELRAAMSLAQFWQQQAKAEAQALLAPVYGWFREV